MCGLYGFVDARQRLTQRQLNRLAMTLGAASEPRGTDATGVAFLQTGRIRVVKRACRNRPLQRYMVEI